MVYDETSLYVVLLRNYRTALHQKMRLNRGSQKNAMVTALVPHEILLSNDFTIRLLPMIATWQKTNV